MFSKKPSILSNIKPDGSFNYYGISLTERVTRQSKVDNVILTGI